MWQSLSGIARTWFGRSKKSSQRLTPRCRRPLFEAVESRHLLTTLSISAEPLAENAAGGFWLIRSGDLAAPLDVHVQVSSATATAGSDFTAVDRTVQFAADQTQMWIEVEHLDDNLAETTEGYAIAASASDGAAASGQGWIVDNDGTSTSGALWIQGNSYAENGSAGFWIGRDGDTSAAVDIDVAVSSGTAVAGSDFTAVYTTVHLTAGQSQAWVEIQHLDDTIAEGSENYTISASASDGRTASGEGWIVDNDGSSNSGTAPAILDFSCSLSGTVLTVSGRIVDDFDPTGYWVYFSDLLEGYSVQVLEDDTFELIITGWTQHGDISAWVTDDTQLTSQIVWDVV